MKARIAEKIAAARAEVRLPAASSASEAHYTPHQVAKMWSLSPDKIRRMFRDMPGVLKIADPRTRRRTRVYVSIRIPQSVLDKVHAEMSQ